MRRFECNAHRHGWRHTRDGLLAPHTFVRSSPSPPRPDRQNQGFPNARKSFNRPRNQVPVASTNARGLNPRTQVHQETQGPCPYASPPQRLSAEPTSSSSGSRLSRPAAATAVPDRSPHPRISETRQSKHSGRPGRLSPFLAPLALASLTAGSIASRAADQALLSAPHRFESGRGPQRGTPRPTGPSFSPHGGNSHFSPLSSQQPSCSSEFADATVEAWQA